MHKLRTSQADLKLEAAMQPWPLRVDLLAQSPPLAHLEEHPTGISAAESRLLNLTIGIKHMAIFPDRRRMLRVLVESIRARHAAEDVPIIVVYEGELQGLQAVPLFTCVDMRCGGSFPLLHGMAAWVIDLSPLDKIPV